MLRARLDVDIYLSGYVTDGDFGTMACTGIRWTMGFAVLCRDGVASVKTVGVDLDDGALSVEQSPTTFSVAIDSANLDSTQRSVARVYAVSFASQGLIISAVLAAVNFVTAECCRMSILRVAIVERSFSETSVEGFLYSEVVVCVADLVLPRRWDSPAVLRQRRSKR